MHDVVACQYNNVFGDYYIILCAFVSVPPIICLKERRKEMMSF